MPSAPLADLHMDPIDPLPNVTTHSLVGELTAEAIDEAVAVAALRTRPS